MKLAIDYNIKHLNLICEMFGIEKLFQKVLVDVGSNTMPITTMNHALISATNAYQISEYVMPKNKDAIKTIIVFCLLRATNFADKLYTEESLCIEAREFIKDVVDDPVTMATKLNSVINATKLILAGDIDLLEEPLWVQVLHDANVSAMVSSNWINHLKEAIPMIEENQSTVDSLKAMVYLYISRLERTPTYIEVFKSDFLGRILCIKSEMSVFLGEEIN